MLEQLDLSPADTVLDASAGTGMLAEAIHKKFGPFRRMVVNDPSEKMLEQAKYRLRYTDAEFTPYFAEELPFEDDSFTQIICMSSFHYYTGQKKVLNHFRRLLSPGGTLWLQDWNRTGFFSIVNAGIRFLTSEHIRTRSAAEMKNMLNAAGFEVIDENNWRFRWWKFFFFKCR